MSKNTQGCRSTGKKSHNKSLNIKAKLLLPLMTLEVNTNCMKHLRLHIAFTYGVDKIGFKQKRYERNCGFINIKVVLCDHK